MINCFSGLHRPHPSTRQLRRTKLQLHIGSDDRSEDYAIIRRNWYCTLKKFLVDPESKVPYWISVCLAKSSADSIGVSMRSTVKKAARLAVYDEIIISVKNHHTLPTIRPDMDLDKPGHITRQPLTNRKANDIDGHSLHRIAKSTLIYGRKVVGGYWTTSSEETERGSGFWSIVQYGLSTRFPA